MNKNNFEMAASNSISKTSRVFHVFNHCFNQFFSCFIIFLSCVFRFFINVTEKGGSKYGVQQGIAPIWVPVRRF